MYLIINAEYTFQSKSITPAEGKSLIDNGYIVFRVKNGKFEELASVSNNSTMNWNVVDQEV